MDVGHESDEAHVSGSATMHREGRSALLAGIEVRDDDVETKPGLHIANVAFRVATVVILLLAAYQCYDWFRDPPPGGTGMSVIIGDTIRLAVVALLLYGAADLADLMLKNHYELRATRILLARQTYILKQWMAGEADLRPRAIEGNRRGMSPEELVVPGNDDLRA